MSVCSGLNALFSSQKKNPPVSVHQKAGRGCRGWGVEPLLEFSRSLHHLVLVGRCPEQLDSGLASNRQHVLAPGAARPHQSRMLAANQSSDFHPPTTSPLQTPPTTLSRVNPRPAARPGEETLAWR